MKDEKDKDDRDRTGVVVDHDNHQRSNDSSGMGQCHGPPLLAAHPVGLVSNHHAEVAESVR